MALPFVVQLPCELEAVTKIAFVGIALVIVTPLAVAGPWLVATTVKVTLFPTTTWLGAAEIPTSATSAEFPSTQHAGCNVVRFSNQPPLIYPESGGASSYTNNCQAPFGFVPWNTDRSATYGPA